MAISKLLREITKATAFLTIFSLTTGSFPKKANLGSNMLPKLAYSVLIDNPTDLERIVRTDPLLEIQKRINAFERENIKPDPYVDAKKLLQKIIGYKLNTGKFSPEQAVGLLEKGVSDAKGLPKYIDQGFLYCIGNNESDWNPNAINKKSGATGLWQIMENTWKHHNPGVAFNKAYNPELNLKTAIKEIEQNERYFKRFYPGDWENLPIEEKFSYHLAAYNYGSRKVKERDWNLNKVPGKTKRFILDVLKEYNALTKT